MTMRGPAAASYEVRWCEDPQCGPHILALDAAGRCIAEIVVPHQGVAELCAALQAIAYQKAVERDE